MPFDLQCLVIASISCLKSNTEPPKMTNLGTILSIKHIFASTSNVNPSSFVLKYSTFK